MRSPFGRMKARVSAVALAVALVAVVAGLSASPARASAAGIAVVDQTSPAVPSSVVVVRMTGDRNVLFTGRISSDTNSMRVRGRVPTSYGVGLGRDHAGSVRVQLRTPSGSGRMQVQLIYQGSVVGTSAVSGGGSVDLSFSVS